MRLYQNIVAIAVGLVYALGVPAHLGIDHGHGAHGHSVNLGPQAVAGMAHETSRHHHHDAVHAHSHDHGHSHDSGDSGTSHAPIVVHGHSHEELPAHDHDNHVHDVGDHWREQGGSLFQSLQAVLLVPVVEMPVAAPIRRTPHRIDSEKLPPPPHLAILSPRAPPRA